MNRHQPFRTRLAALGAVFALTVAACGGSGDATDDETSVLGGTTGSSQGPTETTEATTTTEARPELRGLALELVTSDVSRPVVVTSPPGDERLFIVDRAGIIKMLDPAEGSSVSTFFDISDRVTANGIEQGMLGLAFHPDYASNRTFYVYHVDVQGNRQIAEYKALADDPSQGDLESGRVLWEIPQPGEEIRHYGGWLQFGPDGYLWASIGDGARASVNGQDPGNFYGTIHRIDVDSGDPYGIPADNPFVDGGGAPETWAYGLRNPWRIAVDPVDRMVYIADVGQAALEEIDVVSIDTGGGSNFGWPIMEGTACFNASSCEKDGLVLPVLEYGHDEGCSITGGLVYRGSEIPELDGHYFYADWCTGFVRSFRYVDGEVTDQTDWSDQLPEAGQVNTFGFDSAGELYLANNAGEVYKIVPVR